MVTTLFLEVEAALPCSGETMECGRVNTWTYRLAGRHLPFRTLAQVSSREGGPEWCTTAAPGTAAPGTARVSPGQPGPNPWGPVLGVGVLLFFKERQFSKRAKTCFKKS